MRCKSSRVAALRNGKRKQHRSMDFNTFKDFNTFALIVTQVEHMHLGRTSEYFQERQILAKKGWRKKCVESYMAVQYDKFGPRQSFLV